MLEAQRILFYEKPSVKELAYELGFADPDYFSRLLKSKQEKALAGSLAIFRICPVKSRISLREMIFVFRLCSQKTKPNHTK
jgi:hypothetical protein